MRLLWGLIWASGFFALSLQKPRLLLFSPSVVHLGVPLSVGVKLQDAPSGQVVRGSVFLRNPSTVHKLCSPKVDFSLSSDKDFILLSLPVTGAEDCRLHLLHRAPEVQLVAQSPWLTNRQTNRQGVNLFFSSRRGHLFLQTDQPVYNPGQRVRYRIFALDQEMRPSTDTLTVTVENSRGFRVRKKEVYVPSSIFQDDFVIPDISEPGTWKISARFSDSLDSNSSTQFEVKKYVLPNFEVKIIPEKPYILTTPGFLSEIQVVIQARYIYGKPVQGVAYVRFGLLGEDGKKTFLRGLESQTKLVDGQCRISLPKAEFQGVLEKLNININDLPGLHLYVAAAIIESPGGELEEAELTSWRFVSSPFSLDLSKTKRHLVPGAPFLLQALVRDMSGSPASGIPVKVSATLSSGSTSKNFQQNTDESGQVVVPIIVPQTTSEVQLLVSAGSPYSAIGRLTVKAPLSRRSGFLSIERLDPRPPKVRDTLNLNLRAVGISGSFSHFYYMILSRGRIVSVHREPRRDLTSVSVFVDHHLAPSFHFVAFYYHEGVPVANSLRVDVQAGGCEGKLELNVDGSKEYRPGDTVKLNLQTDSPALVALGAMDTALYAVGGKSHKPLDMVKVFEAMNSYDLGCGPGGGDSALQTFEAAGLAFSDGDQLTPVRKSLRCPKERKARKKRNVNFQKAINEKLGQYASPTAKRCCQDGLTRLPMARTCEQRVARVQQPACREPFLSCCQLAEALGDLIDEDDIPVRSFFPENWLWKVEAVDRFSHTGAVTLPGPMASHMCPLSPSGLCVATPARLRVFREFHMHLRLPVSVRRFEQLELRPVLYNYLDTDTTNEGAIHREEMVYELNPLDPRGRTLEIPGISDPNIIPDGDFRSFVRVTASDPLDTLGSEGALSPGGLASLLRLPQGCGEQTMVLLAPTLAASRYLDKTEQWSMLPPEMKDHAVDLIQKGYTRIQEFRKPDGSYGAWLKRDSSTWAGRLGHGAREGRRSLPPPLLVDVSFSPPSNQGGLVGNDETVALTAFVVIALHHGLAVFPDKNSEQLEKVENSISSANTFLGAKVSSGLLGSHAAAITAYALSLTEAPEDLRDVAHNNLMAMAQETGDNLYWGSVTSSQSNVLSPTLAPQSPADPVPQAPALWIETTAYGLLHLLLREGKGELADQAASWLTLQGSFQGGFRSTQDTVMALDALSAYWIASHTTEEKGLNVTLNSMGRSGLKSHVLQLTNHQVQGLEEELQFSLGSKINVKVGGNSKGTLKVRAGSTGQGAEGLKSLSPGRCPSVWLWREVCGPSCPVSSPHPLLSQVLHTYNVMDMKNTTCQDLQIEVTVVGHVEYTMEANEDYEDYEYEDLPARDEPGARSQPVTPLQLFDGRRSRRRREAPKVAEEQEPRVQYTVCIWRNGKVGLSGMAIADITLLSGFHALRADLEKLTSLSDRYVSHFETEGPHVVLYFDSVPMARECVGFGAVQDVAVGLVQPASAILYDYYNPEHKCSVFYGAPTKSKLLSTLCSGDVCQCAEGKCPRQRRALEQGRQDMDGYRMKFACYFPRVDYGFQVKVLREDSRAAFRLFETSITQVLHFTKDTKATAGQTRNFLVRASCRLHLEPGKKYLIMGLDGTTHDLNGDPQYLLDSNSWIEEMPSERLCQSTRQRAACAQLSSFLQEYGTQGCQV
uniref:C4a anaphylatoxin n=1 Tax=Balaenoptera musculus TaxID=9771 RepID=A0A8C0E2Y3_BALMU